MIGSWKTCHKCRQPYQAGCVTVGFPTCDDCKVKVQHLLHVFSGNLLTEDERIGALCGEYMGWPHTWPEGHGGEAILKRIRLEKFCKKCLEKYNEEQERNRPEDT